MAGFAFKSRQDIEKVLKLIGKGGAVPRSGVVELGKFGTNMIFYTPAGGIAARSGATAGSAACTPYYVDASDTMTELTDIAGNSQTIDVKNIFSTAITGNAYITAKLVGNYWIADAEDCT